MEMVYRQCGFLIHPSKLIELMEWMKVSQMDERGWKYLLCYLRCLLVSKKAAGVVCTQQYPLMLSQIYQSPAETGFT